MSKCQGIGPHLSVGGIRLLPRKEGNLYLCRACFAHEISWRRAKNKTLPKRLQFPIMKWDQLKEE